MSIAIYDAQYAAMIYPDIRSDEDVEIRRFLVEQLGLYIKKIGDNITIYCKVLAHGISDKLKGYYIKYSNRVEGFYIVYSDKYTQNSFTDFKQEIEKNFQDLGLELIFTEETDNILFKNIEKFDQIDPRLNNPLLPKDFDDTIYLLKKHKHLEFKSGKIRDIITFCRNVLENMDVSIAIFTGDKLPNEGNINISLDKNPNMSFSLTDKTKDILAENKNELEKKEKEKIRQDKIKEIKDELNTAIKGLDVANVAIDNIKKSGYDRNIKDDPVIDRLKDTIINKSTTIRETYKSGLELYVILLGIVIFGVGMISGAFLCAMGECNLPFQKEVPKDIIPIPAQQYTIANVSPSPLSTQSPITESPIITGNITDTDNITADNITDTGNITDTDNITADNITDTGNITDTDNITADNITDTGNITAGNVAGTGNITVTGR